VRKLTLPGASFTHVTYASAQHLVSVDWKGRAELIAMSGGDRLAVVWSVAENRVIAELKQSEGVNHLAFAACGRLAVAASRTVRLWDAATGELLHKFRSFRKFVRALAVSPNGRLIAAAGGGVVCVWDAASGAEVANYDWGAGEIKSLAFSPDGATAAAAGEKAVVVWDVD
jgi:WD40 repeat protein